MWLNQIYFLFYFKHSLYNSFITQKKTLLEKQQTKRSKQHSYQNNENFWWKRPNQLKPKRSFLPINGMLSPKESILFFCRFIFHFSNFTFHLTNLVCFEWKDDNHSISDDIFITQVVEHKSPHPQLTLLFRKLLRVEQLQHTCYTTMRMYLASTLRTKRREKWKH